MNFNKCNIFLNKYSIDNFDYKIPKMQEMNQFNLTQLKEMKRKLKAKSKSNLS